MLVRFGTPIQDLKVSRLTSPTGQVNPLPIAWSAVANLIEIKNRMRTARPRSGAGRCGFLDRCRPHMVGYRNAKNLTN
jgi:hypothetical protein